MPKTSSASTSRPTATWSTNSSPSGAARPRARRRNTRAGVASVDEIVLDASAIIALLRDEPGRELVAASLAGGILSVVNAAEVLTWAVDRGAPIGQAESSLDALDLRVVPFDRDIAVAAAALRPATRKLGLSLGDRACLALA
ncbi:MAG: type II toxin-antitoxin system VapC family toxin, partial [Alphaproteobacteria bacterium]|nr:type II toxin-antitoxin system VapC family toxin [Alphaproteobacteria bacterium]